MYLALRARNHDVPSLDPSIPRRDRLPLRDDAALQPRLYDVVEVGPPQQVDHRHGGALLKVDRARCLELRKGPSRVEEGRLYPIVQLLLVLRLELAVVVLVREEALALQQGDGRADTLIT